MTATKYALVPVVATTTRRNPDQSLDEVIGHGVFHVEQMSSTHWSARLCPYLVGFHSSRPIRATLEVEPIAAAPKELPEDVVERVAKALYYAHEGFKDGAWEREKNSKYPDHYRMLARAALLAVMGVGDER